MRLGIESDDYFVEYADRSVRATRSVHAERFDEFAEDGTARFEIVLEAEHWQGDAARFVACQTHHADATASRWRGNGDDGVVEIHNWDCKGTTGSFYAPVYFPVRGSSWDRRRDGGACLLPGSRCANLADRARRGERCGVRAMT